ncbi:MULTISPECIES: hypothetical protein [Streptomyces]|uniref:Uncharacterized protein n=1 Tax=Streptomyces griseus subsp. griseus (strain JCM 4626 / CBS 651.72 / NBRC 13350 / KCC S-0626 / ISP 5235) TaxID=455632 RepID=B1VM10_STRGG|nr:hypothetical protein [Streptomyces griseus]BAG16911.1 hypothetical protein SGR_82t [Streptomyces griseus subsp. griseus NBRC 13350]BAG23884.1 hypothetical protein SGR_7057t [Streptomyces griseus subsp. griseus NBRC 13350]SEE21753.1 hypothetical protein SAMN04490359_2230 [Streptomyces griseus]SQA26662.1 Uncharacterised protein [Streptomyces griseus]
MGMDLTVFMVDWGQLGTVPVEHRIGRLEDLAWPGELSDVYDGGAERAHGWLWPPGQAPAWCAVYRFLTTTGAHMPHVRAGAAWADMRPLVGPPVREVMDSFLEGLIWDGDQADAPAPVGVGAFPAAADRWHPNVLLVCLPEAVAGKARAWERMELYLEKLSGPFAVECEGWAGRPDTFEGFVALLREWGAVVTEAARRGWGLVGLP